MAVNMSMNVLIVDDYKTMLRIVNSLLKQLGFQNIYEATDGGMALSMLRERDYGLVISDWNMEPMKLKATPFIMVTAESKTENVVMAKQAGVNNYIVKPFNAETLKSKIVTVLGQF
jgi:two-component system, chemotaxis family, chemotaxis protein CheY